MKRILLTMSLLLTSAPAWAGVCTTMITRVCQPGKACRSSETFTQLVNSHHECLNNARRFCPVYFTEGVAGKHVKANFDGAPLNGGGNLCQ